MPIPSVSTLAGLILGFGLCIWAVVTSTKNVQVFLHLQSFAIVIGGTLATTLVGYRSRYVLNAIVSIGRIFVMQAVKPGTLRNDIKRLVEWSIVAQQGLGSLEDETAKLKLDPFFKYSVSLLMNGYKEPDLRLLIGDFIESSHGRRMIPANILNQMGAAAPAFGMVGTLVGLVIMLSQMGSDPSALGPAMGVALLTTLYGVLAARLVFLPAASKTQQVLEIERYRRYMILEGLVMISQKRPPIYVQDRLNALLDPAFQYDHFGKPTKKGAKAPARS